MDVKISIDTGAVISTQNFYNELGRRYEEVLGHEASLHDVVRLFLSLLPSNAPVLDCGCGTGRPVSSMIAQSSRKPYGIDFSHTMVELSKKQVPQGEFHCYSTLDYVPSTANFGGLIASLSLFGLSRAELISMTHKFFRWIQPNGLLLIVVSSIEDWDVKQEQLDADGQFASGVENTFMGHKSFMTLFTRAGWNRLLEDAGFEVVHADTNVFTASPNAACDDDPHYFVIAKKPCIL